MNNLLVLVVLVLVGLLFDVCDSKQLTDEAAVLPEKVKRSAKAAKSFILRRKKRGGFEDDEEEEEEEFDWEEEEEKGGRFGWRNWEEMH